MNIYYILSIVVLLMECLSYKRCEYWLLRNCYLIGKKEKLREKIEGWYN